MTTWQFHQNAMIAMRKTPPDSEDGKLERLVKHIEPSWHDVTDEDIKDRGRMTPAAPPTDNRT